jgi:hypothetical protein
MGLVVGRDSCGKYRDKSIHKTALRRCRRFYDRADGKISMNARKLVAKIASKRVHVRDRFDGVLYGDLNFSIALLVRVSRRGFLRCFPRLLCRCDGDGIREASCCDRFGRVRGSGNSPVMGPIHEIIAVDMTHAGYSMLSDFRKAFFPGI